VEGKNDGATGSSAKQRGKVGGLEKGETKKRSGKINQKKENKSEAAAGLDAAV